MTERHLAGKHDQASHGKGGGAAWAPGNWHAKTPDEVRGEQRAAMKLALERRGEVNPSAERIEEMVIKNFDSRSSSAEKSIVYENGHIRLTVHDKTGLTQADQTALLSQIDRLQTIAPLERVSLDVWSRRDSDRPFSLGNSPAGYGQRRVVYGIAMYDQGRIGLDAIGLRGIAKKTDFDPAKDDGSWFTPSRQKTSLGAYVVAHEWGHLAEGSRNRKIQQNDDHPWYQADRKFRMLHADDPISKYGKTNGAEFAAEAFAEWFHAGKDSPVKGLADYAAGAEWGGG